MYRKSIFLVILSAFFTAGLLACGETPDAGDSTTARIGNGNGVDPPADLPPGHPPLADPSSGMAPVPPPAGSGTGETGFGWKAPADWVEEPPASSMRKAQYKVPGSAGEAECVVFYFGPGQGGDPMSNARRWAHQFEQPDGSPSTEAMKISEFDANGNPAILVEVTGTYSSGGAMMRQPAEKNPDYMLLGAVVQGPDANWFFKFTGPEATVREQQGAFEKMLRSLETDA